MTGKKRKSKKNNNIGDTIGSETFFLTFVGEMVEIAGSFYHGEQEAALKVTGFILDADEDYLYLGDTPEEITSAIKRDRIIYIQVLELVDPYLEELQGMEIPEDDTKRN